MPRFSKKFAEYFFQASRVALSDSAKTVASTVALHKAWNTYQGLFEPPTIKSPDTPEVMPPKAEHK